MGVLFAWGFALVGTFVILKFVDAVTGLRVPKTTKSRAWTSHNTAKKHITWNPEGPDVNDHYMRREQIFV